MAKKKTAKKAAEKPTYPDTPWGHKQRQKAEEKPKQKQE